MHVVSVKTIKKGWYVFAICSRTYETYNGTYYCPCVRCWNKKHQDFGEIDDHLFVYDIVKSYTIWTWHGEVLDNPATSQTTKYVEEWMNDPLEDMVRDVGEENFGRAHVYDPLKEELYLGLGWHGHPFWVTSIIS